jgi:hypothetical protein
VRDMGARLSADERGAAGRLLCDRREPSATAVSSVNGVVVWFIAVAAARGDGLGWLHVCACGCHLDRQEDVR